MHDPVLSIAASSAPLNLVDFIKPVLAIIPFFAYLRLVSSKIMIISCLPLHPVQCRFKCQTGCHQPGLNDANVALEDKG